jgi:hypothetical protein
MFVQSAPEHRGAELITVGLNESGSSTLDPEVFIGGIEWHRTKSDGVKAYDLGGEVHYRPAPYLIELAIEATQSTLTKMAEVSALTLSFGVA